MPITELANNEILFKHWFMGFSVDTPVENAIDLFKKKYKHEPQIAVKDKHILYVGPIGGKNEAL